jgi:hypothetical protein
MNPTHTATLILTCWAVNAAGQSNVVITSFQGNGTLSWTSGLSNATHYVVEVHRKS